MLRRSRLFEQPSPSVLFSHLAAELTRVWREWQGQESRNRYAEMYLFQDTTSTLFNSVTDFNTSVPSSDRLWRATSAEQWAQEIRQLDGGTISFPPSLNEHVKRFRVINVDKDFDTFTPITLRLLLYHLQKVVAQSGKASMYRPRVPSHGRHLVVLYHLISLNTLTNFPDVERFARNDDNIQTHESPCWVRSHHFEDRHRIFFHCGQVLHTSMEFGESTRVVLDDMAPDHTLIEAYLERHEGFPVFTQLQGGYLSLDVPDQILTHHASVLGTDPQLSFVKGVQLKLLKLAARWQQSTPKRT
ncbi:unnamed protein product [Aureobasidium mustum]|uniref:Uncharacterized protein n=1 Tax=Aureobasidium mustum TaxID=2773714 RepID=A0A9N8PL47_9PEZI|nr:unnamed protein product [Aureobasidium mustum]